MMLTPRQWEVGERVALGMSNKAIARDLGISEHAVEWHVKQAANRIDMPGPQRYRIMLFFLLDMGDDESDAA